MKSNKRKQNYIEETPILPSLPDEAIKEFQDLFQKVYCKDISFKTAKLKSNKLFYSIAASFKPIPKNTNNE